MMRGSFSQRLYIYSAILLFGYFMASGENRTFSWHQGSQYALVRAMADSGTFVIDEYRGPAGGDVAYRDGRHYSAKNPGPSFLALPFYLLGSAIASLPGIPAGMRETTKMFFTRVFPALMGVMAAILGFWFLGGPQVFRAWSPGVVLLLGIGTHVGKYAVHLFAHAPSTAFVMLCLVSLAKEYHNPSIGWSTIAGWSAGMAFLMEPNTVLLIPVMFMYYTFRSIPLTRIMASMAGLSLPLSVLGFYQWSCFGHPMALAAQFHPLAHDGIRNVTAPDWRHLKRLLFEMSNEPRAGMLIMSPLMVLAPLGIWRLWRTRGCLQVLMLVMAALGPLVMASMLGTNYFGGGTNDIRYITCTEFLLLLLSLHFVAEHIEATSGIYRWVFAIVVSITIAWQFLIHVYFRVIHADRYLGDFIHSIIGGSNLSDLFRNAEGVTWNTGVFLGITLISVIIYEFIKRAKGT